MFFQDDFNVYIRNVIDNGSYFVFRLYCTRKHQSSCSNNDKSDKSNN
jgi:hypothetical protein